MKFFDPQGDIEKTIHELPHWQQGEVALFVTFRLADSLPGNGVRETGSEGNGVRQKIN